MINPPVEFHPEAQAEYLAALSWYRERSPMAALRFEAEFTRSVEKIQKSPERWASYGGDSRRFLLHQFPFGIVYHSSSRRIFILAVAHGHRQPGYWKSRH
jgi:plasmid stabilization system protein ParE